MRTRAALFTGLAAGALIVCAMVTGGMIVGPHRIAAAPALVDMAERPYVEIAASTPAWGITYVLAEQPSGSVLGLKWDGSQYYLVSLNPDGTRGALVPIGLEATRQANGRLPYAVDGRGRVWLSSGGRIGYIDTSSLRFVDTSVPAVVSTALTKGWGLPAESRDMFGSQLVSSMVSDSRGDVWAVDFDNHLFSTTATQGPAVSSLALSSVVAAGPANALVAPGAAASDSAPSAILGYPRAIPGGLLFSTYWSSAESSATQSIRVDSVSGTASLYARTGYAQGAPLAGGSVALASGTTARIVGADAKGVWTRESDAASLRSVDVSGTGRTARLDGVATRPDAVIAISSGGDVWYWADSNLQVRKYDAATGNVYRYQLPVPDDVRGINGGMDASPVAKSTLVDSKGNLWLTYCCGYFHTVVFQH